MPADGRRIKGSADERAGARDRLRAELLAAARSIAEEEGAGFDRVTVRSVADRVGYTAPIVYQFFANKRALLIGLIELGFAELARELGRAQRPEKGDDRLLAVATAYWEFAVRNPHLYRLMHTLPDIPFGTRQAPAAARECFAVLKSALREGSDDTADLFWAHLHGVVSLTLDGRIKGGPKRARELLPALTAAH